MTIENQHDDAEFALFLQGEGALSQRLKALPQASPPPEMDTAILATISAALAQEKAQLAAPANDPVGPAPVDAAPARNPLRSGYMPWLRISVGIAAGVLVTILFRHTWDAPSEPGSPQASQVAMLPAAAPDVAPPTLAARQEDVPPAATAKSRVLVAPVAADKAVAENQKKAIPRSAATAPAEVAVAVSIVRLPVVATAAAPAAPVVVSAPVAPVAAMAAPSPAMAAAPRPVQAPPPVFADVQPAVPVDAKPAPAHAIAMVEPPARPVRESPVERVVVTGAHASLQQSQSQKRDAANPVEVITSNDVAKMPDKNAADAAQRTKGINTASLSSGTSQVWAVTPDQPASPLVAQEQRPDGYALSAPAKAYNAQPAAPALAYSAPPAPLALPPALAARAPDARVVIASGRAIDRPTTAPDAPLPAKAWIALIREQLKERLNDKALDEWARFRKDYPDYPAPDDLVRNIKTIEDASAKK